MAPREGLGFVLVKMGRAGPPFEPRRRPQAGKSGDPRSQNADSSPRAQGAPGLGRAGRQKGKSKAPRALTAYGLGRRVAVDWTWAALFAHALLILRHARRTRSRTQPLPFLLLERARERQALRQGFLRRAADTVSLLGEELADEDARLEAEGLRLAAERRELEGAIALARRRTVPALRDGTGTFSEPVAKVESLHRYNL